MTQMSQPGAESTDAGSATDDRLTELINELRQFNHERDWDQFHSPENLAKSICLEAAELLENFQWASHATDPHNVEEELADVLTYCLMMADRLGLDPVEIVRTKLTRTRQKYPVELARGRSTKYDRL